MKEQCPERCRQAYQYQKEAITKQEAITTPGLERAKGSSGYCNLEGTEPVERGPANRSQGLGWKT